MEIGGGVRMLFPVLLLDLSRTHRHTQRRCLGKQVAGEKRTPEEPAVIYPGFLINVLDNMVAILTES